MLSYWIYFYTSFRIGLIPSAFAKLWFSLKHRLMRAPYGLAWVFPLTKPHHNHVEVRSGRKTVHWRVIPAW